MSPDADPTLAYDQVLNEVAQLSLSLARDLHDAALNAETSAEKAVLADGYHKVTRGLRQTLALHSKLARDHQAFRRDFGPQIARDHAQKVSRRRTEVYRALEQCIWTENEKPEFVDFMTGELLELLEDECLKPAFLEEPVDIQIRRIRHLMDLDEHARQAAAEEDAHDAADDPPPPAADSS